MEKIIASINQLSQLEAYRQIRKIILAKMDAGKIEPQTALDLIKKTKELLEKMKTSGEITNVLKDLAILHPELNGLADAFEQLAMSKTDDFLANLWEELLTSDLDTAGKLMKKSRGLKNAAQMETFLEELKKSYPEEFSSALNKTNNS